jgi:uncharacterized membrane protein
MRLDLRSIRALALVAWAGVFTWLWVSGESVRYLGPRTQWVVPVGAIGLTLCSPHAPTSRPGSPCARVSAWPAWFCR